MGKAIADARKVMRDSFKKDPDFRHTYQANIAMLLYDRRKEFSNKKLEDCNKLADMIIDLIFTK